MKKSLRGPLFLLMCAFFWGMCFSAQSDAMDHIGPYTFVFSRSAITSLILFAVMPLLNRISGEDRPKASNKRHLLLGAALGFILVVASTLQQVGIMTTTAAKSGFITALYLVLVPIFGMFMGKRPAFTVWIGVAVSLVGLYLLCIRDSFTLSFGDALTLLCAVAFSFHIIFVDRFGGELNSVKLSAIQFGTAAICSGILMIILEEPTLSGVIACLPSILFAAVFSGAIGYTFQIIGQKDTEPTLASIIMCLESVFAAIGGWIILGERLTGREILGCVLMFTASILALLPAKKRGA